MSAVELLFKVVKLSLQPEGDSVIVELTRYVEETEVVDVYQERIQRAFKEPGDDLPPKIKKFMEEIFAVPPPPRTHYSASYYIPECVITLPKAKMAGIWLGSLVKVTVETAEPPGTPVRNPP